MISQIVFQKYFLLCYIKQGFKKPEPEICEMWIHSDSRHCNAMPDQVRILFITTYFQALKYLHCCSNFPNENSIRWKHTLFKVSRISSAIWHTYIHLQNILRTHSKSVTLLERWFPLLQWVVCQNIFSPTCQHPRCESGIHLLAAEHTPCSYFWCTDHTSFLCFLSKFSYILTS